MHIVDCDEMNIFNEKNFFDETNFCDKMVFCQKSLRFELVWTLSQYFSRIKHDIKNISFYELKWIFILSDG